MEKLGFGDALGTAPMHFRPGGGDDKPTPVKPESISSSSSNSGSPGAPPSGFPARLRSPPPFRE